MVPVMDLNIIKVKGDSRLFLSRSAVQVILALCIGFSMGCDSNPTIDDPPPEDPFEDSGLVAFIVYYLWGNRLAVAPLNDLQNYTFLTADTTKYYDFPRFSPGKDRIIITDSGGPSFVYDISSSTFSEIVTGPVNGSLGTAVGSVVWDESGDSFFYGQTLGISPGAQPRIFHFISGTSRVVSPDLFNTVPQALLGPDSLIVLSGESNQKTASGLHLQILIPTSGDLVLIPNPKISSDPNIPGSERITRNADWDPVNRLLGVGVTSEAGTSLLSTDLSGNIYQEWKSVGSSEGRPRWGPGGILLYNNRPSGATYSDAYQLMGLNTNNDQIVVLLDASLFPGAIGVGSPDY